MSFMIKYHFIPILQTRRVSCRDVQVTQLDLGETVIRIWQTGFSLVAQNIPLQLLNP